MTRQKAFDCVEMKNRIQQDMLKRFEGRGNDEIRQAIRNELQTSDHPLAQKWRALKKEDSRN